MAIETKISPMMMQWHECKKKAPEALLFFRLGDFYEAFFEDAITLSKELDLTLTKRQDIPMAGVPAHTAENYIDKLVSKGYRIAIAEQLEDPKAVKGIVKREIVRIITPGSVINSSLLAEKSNNFIASLHQINRTLGLSILDLTTAEFKVYEFENSDTLMDELFRLRPKEILVSQKCSTHQKKVLDTLSLELSTSIIYREDWHFDPQATVNFLVRHFKLHSVDSFGLQPMPCATSCAGALLSYLQNELNVSIDHILSVQKENTSKYMSLDSSTQKHLELAESLHEKQNQYTLLSFLDNTLTAMGGRMLSFWLLHPLMDISEITRRQDAVEFFSNFSEKKSLQHTLGQIKDLERLIMKIEMGYANPRDLLGLGLSLAVVPEAAKILENRSLPSLLSEQIHKLSDVKLLSDTICGALMEELPLKIGDGPIFRYGYHHELDEYRLIQSKSNEWMANYQMELRSSTGIKTLKVGYTRAFGYYIEVSRGQADKIPVSFDRRQTLVNAERFITQELKEYEYKVLSAEEKIASIENELFIALRQEIRLRSTEIRSIASALAHIDCLLSLSIVAQSHQLVRPLIDESSIFNVEASRHPVIEASLKSESFIANDVHLDDALNKLYLITGPNMAGKSTFIRQVALLAILAQMGSFVPARKAHIGIIDKVFTRIGASDNLSRGQSTFMVEMTETAHILHNTTSKSLVILDEIGRGTSTYDGISIAWAVAEYLLTTPGKTPKTLFATHYCEMIELESKIPGALNYHIAVHESEKEIVFLRKIVRGGTDKSYGIHVARLAGLPANVIKKAKEVLKALEEKTGKVSVQPKKEKDLQQLSLFTYQDFPAIDPDPILTEIREMEPNSLTPMEALQKIMEWKSRV
ncbi:MAG: DNA mismatch repair protein MutS [Chlamydiae bacterium]|nr:DNA mismatch repair protein MutS [Chlamydiota bacterium]